MILTKNHRKNNQDLPLKIKQHTSSYQKQPNKKQNKLIMKTDQQLLQKYHQYVGQQQNYDMCNMPLLKNDIPFHKQTHKKKLTINTQILQNRNNKQINMQEDRPMQSPIMHNFRQQQQNKTEILENRQNQLSKLYARSFQQSKNKQILKIPQMTVENQHNTQQIRQTLKQSRTNQQQFLGNATFRPKIATDKLFEIDNNIKKTSQKCIRKMYCDNDRKITRTQSLKKQRFYVNNQYQTKYQLLLQRKYGAPYLKKNQSQANFDKTDRNDNRVDRIDRISKQKIYYQQTPSYRRLSTPKTYHRYNTSQKSRDKIREEISQKISYKRLSKGLDFDKSKKCRKLSNLQLYKQRICR